MSNIRVDVGYTIKDGAEIKFRSPVDCSQVTGLKVYYPGADGNITSKEFAFADAHGNNVGDIDHLFAENVVVKVILDVTTGMAFVQNADTNAYLEGHIQSKRNPHGVTAEQVGARPNDWMPTAAQVGASPSSHLNDKNNPHGVTIAQIGAAPAGYGLGNDFETVSDKALLDKRCLTGWVRYSNQNSVSLISGFDICHAIIRIDSMTNNTGHEYATQTAYIAYNATYKGCVIQRYCYDGVWDEWGWVDPPDTTGVEYRTTDTYGSRRVYRQSFDFGALPNNTSASIPTGIPAGWIVRMDGYGYNQSTGRLPFPLCDSTGAMRGFFYVDTSGSLIVRTFDDRSNWTGRFTLWYIKI